MLLASNPQNKKYKEIFYGHDIKLNNIDIDYPETKIAGSSSILARAGIPHFHIKVADNYMVIKRIYGFPLVQSRITEDEKELLLQYDFNVLEFSNFKQIEEELSFLKKWSSSKNMQLKEDSDKILEIRNKELKYLIATKFVNVSNKNYNGFIALDRYFSNISKYFRRN